MKVKLIPAAVAFSLAIAGAFAEDALVNGEVKKIDVTAAKISIRHGAIKKLDMDDGEMTMVFRVQDPAMLKSVKVGDKIKFDVERTSAGLTITKLEKSK